MPSQEYHPLVDRRLANCRVDIPVRPVVLFCGMAHFLPVVLASIMLAQGTVSDGINIPDNPSPFRSKVSRVCKSPDEPTKID